MASWRFCSINAFSSAIKPEAPLSVIGQRGRSWPVLEEAALQLHPQLASCRPLA